VGVLVGRTVSTRKVWTGGAAGSAPGRPSGEIYVGYRAAREIESALPEVPEIPHPALDDQGASFARRGGEQESPRRLNPRGNDNRTPLQRVPRIECSEWDAPGPGYLSYQSGCTNAARMGSKQNPPRMSMPAFRMMGCDWSAPNKIAPVAPP